MTELFGRLAPGATSMRPAPSCATAHGRWSTSIREAYPKKADFRIDAVRLRDQITSPARTVLLVLLAASALVFHHCVLERRQPDPRALGPARRRAGDPRRARCQRRRAAAHAAGRKPAALRRRRAARRADRAGRWWRSWRVMRPASRCARSTCSVDASMLWVGVGLALVAAVLLAFVPRLPVVRHRRRFGTVERQRPHHVRHQPPAAAFAMTQIAASFVLLAGAGMLLTTLFALQRADDRLRHAQCAGAERPGHGLRAAAASRSLPLLQGSDAADRARSQASSAWRSARWCRGAKRARFGPGASSRPRATPRPTGEEDPRARFRTVSPGFFAALGVPIIAGRDFNASDRNDSEQVVIVSQSVAQRLFPDQDAVNRRMHLDRPGDEVHRRQHQSAADRRRRRRCRRRERGARPGDDGLSPVRAGDWRRPPVRARAGPIRTRWSLRSRASSASCRPDQPVERAATLEDVRAEVLAPDRLNALVFGVFARSR